MSESFVLKKQCERCPAVEEQVVSTEDIKAGKVTIGATKGPPRYQILVAGKESVSYNRLCAACEAAVSKAVADIAKKREKKTSQRS